jgi:PAS domain-containing protein
MDITDRRQMEEILRITKFSFDKTAIGIYHVVSDAQILEVNDHAAKKLEYTPDDMSVKTTFDIDPLVTRDDWGGI